LSRPGGWAGPGIFLDRDKMLADKGEEPAGDYTTRLGTANVEREGSDVTLISYGRPLQRVVRSAVQALVHDELRRHRMVAAQSIRFEEIAQQARGEALWQVVEEVMFPSARAV